MRHFPPIAHMLLLMLSGNIVISNMQCLGIISHIPPTGTTLNSKVMSTRCSASKTNNSCPSLSPALAVAPIFLPLARKPLLKLKAGLKRNHRRRPFLLWTLQRAACFSRVFCFRPCCCSSFAFRVRNPLRQFRFDFGGLVRTALALRSHVSQY